MENEQEPKVEGESEAPAAAPEGTDEQGEEGEADAGGGPAAAGE